MRTRRRTSQTGGVNVPGTVNSIQGDVVGRDKHITGPSIDELEAKEARDRLVQIINQFDRRAVRDHMHEENIFFMLKSLNELRTKIQKIGINTLQNPAVRILLIEIREELEEVEDITTWILPLRPEGDWYDSFLDLRSFGGLQEDVQPKRGNYAMQDRLYEVHRFCFDRIHDLLQDAVNADLRERRERRWPPTPTTNVEGNRTPVNTERLAKDVVCLYLFGHIDQLKMRIIAKLDKIYQSQQA